MNTIITWLRALLIAVLPLTNPMVHAAPQDALPHALPNDAQGLLILDQMTTGSLPFLHGMAGEGRYITLNTAGQLCEITSVRFIAGGLTGQTIGIHPSSTIELIVYDQALSDRIKQGIKSISSDFNVSHTPQEPTGDIHIIGDLSLMDGFIIHPRKAWSSWFGFQPTDRQCTPLQDPERVLYSCRGTCFGK